MERCRSHPVWEARTDFGSVGVIDDADQMPTTPRHRGGRCESGLSEIKRFGVGASLFERNENRVHISDALLISPECPVPAGASRPAGTPVPSAQLLEPHSSASPPVLLHCVHHGSVCSGGVGYGTDVGYESCRQSAFATGSGERGAASSAVSLHRVCDNNILSHTHHG